jgi:hypothetical protein
MKKLPMIMGMTGYELGFKGSDAKTLSCKERKD